MFKGNYVEARTLNDAWRDSLWCCMLNGYTQVKQMGSYAGEKYKQLPYLTIRITDPGLKPVQYLTPQGIPAPTDETKILNYFYDYIINDTRQGNDYTYGHYISNQYDTCMSILRAGYGNQATMRIGDPGSINLEHPPCLTTVSFKIIENTLNMALTFRSWDLFGGLPENLGGLQLLKELIAYDLGLNDGEIIAFTDGGHVYGYVFDIVDQMCIL